MSRASLHETGRLADDARDGIRTGPPAAGVSISASTDACASRPPGTLSCYVTTVTSVAAAITFSASGAAPTPLYHEYQEHFGLTPFVITIIFAAYAFSLLLALLTVGSLSDYVGRRPVILGALMANILAMIVFMSASSAATLVVARTIQGFANGVAITTLAATILDTDERRAPVLNSVTAFAGLSAGTLGAGALVTFAPAPEQLVFIVLLVLSVVEATILWFMPETATPQPGALESLLPHVHVPRIARATFAAITPVTIASWSLGGFYFSLMPSVVRAATGATLPIIGGLVVAALTVSGAVAVVILRKLSPERILILGIITLTLGVTITLTGMRFQNVHVMLMGTIVGGTGFGTAFSGTLQSVLSYAGTHERAGLLSAYFVEGYLAFSLPALLAGFLAPIVGLTRTADFYGASVILLAISTLVVNLLRHRGT
jgi:predicted MFS family arabinose efflux permease